MKNTNMKKLIVACVAAISLIGFQNQTFAEATEILEVNNDNMITIGENNASDEISQQSEEELTLTLHASKPIEGIAIKTTISIQKPITISNKEKDLLARLVEAEAKGESYAGKVAVATVVLNRVESAEFPNNVTDVIHEVVGKAYAFSPVQNGEINNTASTTSKKAVKEALTRKDDLKGSIYFYNPDIATDDWIRSREVVKRIDNHVFAI